MLIVGTIGTGYFFFFYTNAKRRRPIFGAKVEAWRMFHVFHFLQSDVDFGIVNLS